MTIGTIWDKIDPETIPWMETGQPKTAGQSLKTAFPVNRGNWKRRLVWYDVAAYLFWSWLFVKVFVGDVDRTLAGNNQVLSVLLDYRLFVFLVVLAIFVVIGKKAYLGIGYAVSFPLIVVFWKLPKLLLKLRSWNAFLALANALYAFCRHFKRNFIIRVVQIVSILLILTVDTPYVLVPCFLVVILSILYHYSRTLLVAIRASRFLRSQQELVRRVLQSDAVRESYKIKPDLRSPEIERFDKDQVQVFANAVGAGLCVWKVLDIYAFALGRYRRGGAPIIFGLASFLWIFMQSVVALTCMNLIVQKLDPAQFSRPTPSVLSVVYYSISSLYSNTVPVLEPVGDMAIGIQIFAAVYGPILVVTLVAQVLFGARQARDEAKFADVIREVRRNRIELEGRLSEEFEVAPDDALRRLVELSLGMGPLINYMLQKLPDVFEHEDRQG